MSSLIPGKLLRIFLGESDHREGKPLYEWILHRAMEEGVAGATVIRGIEGFGASSKLHTSRILRLSEDLPIVVELVDTADRLETFLGSIEHTMGAGLVTLEDIQFRRTGPATAD